MLCLFLKSINLIVCVWAVVKKYFVRQYLQAAYFPMCFAKFIESVKKNKPALFLCPCSIVLCSQLRNELSHFSGGCRKSYGYNVLLVSVIIQFVNKISS